MAAWRRSGGQGPLFKTWTDDGEAISRAALKGTPYVVYFYPKDDTSGCTKEAIAFLGSCKKFEKPGVPVIGVSKDSLECHAKFRKKHKLKLTLGSDPDIQMAQDWGVWGEKPLWPQVYGHGARHIPDRCQGHHRGGLAQG